MQDMASYGLAAVYTAGDEAAKQRMASTLVETLHAAAGPPPVATIATTSSTKASTDVAAVRATPLFFGSNFLGCHIENIPTLLWWGTGSGNEAVGNCTRSLSHLQGLVHPSHISGAPTAAVRAD